MKKFALAIFLSVLISTVSAQKVRFGAMGGVNSHRMSSSSLDFESQFGFQFGLTSYQKLSEKTAVRVGLLYKQKRTGLKRQAFEFDEFGLVINERTIITDFSYTYMTLPIILEYGWKEKINLLVGTNLDFNLSDEYRIEGEEINLGTRTNTFDFGVNLGLSYEITPALDIAFLYNRNFLNVLEELFNMNTFSNERFSTAFELNLIYYFKDL